MMTVNKQTNKQTNKNTHRPTNKHLKKQTNRFKEIITIILITILPYALVLCSKKERKRGKIKEKNKNKNKKEEEERRRKKKYRLFVSKYLHYFCNSQMIIPQKITIYIESMISQGLYIALLRRDIRHGLLFLP